MFVKQTDGGIKLVLASLFLLVVPSIIAAQRDLQTFVGQKVYVKHNLVFLDNPPNIYPGKIIFVAERDLCDEPLWGFVIGKASYIEIVKMSEEPKFVRVVLNAEKFGNYEVLLARSKRGSYRKSFNEIFSTKPVEETPEDCDPKTERGLIKCFGYPIYTCFKDGKKFFYYNERFVGRRIHGFHDIWFEIKKGKVVNEHGYI